MKNVVIIYGRNEELYFDLKNVNVFESCYLYLAYLYSSNMELFHKYYPVIFNDVLDSNTDFIVKNINLNTENNNYESLKKELESDKNKIFTLYESDKLSVFFAQENFVSLDACNKDIVFASLIKTLMENNEFTIDDKLYYICHDKHFGKPAKTEKLIAGSEKKEVVDKLNELLEIQISKDTINIITFPHNETDYFVYYYLRDFANGKEWSDFDINDLIERFTPAFIQKTKNKTINIFLPLILDIKGFNELPVESKKRKEYLNEIHQSIGKQKPESINNKGKNTSATENDDTLSGYGIDLIFGWNEIKKVLSEKYRITDKASLYFSPLESEEKPGFTIDNIKHLFDDSKKDDRNKAIQWFEDIQKLLNEKVKPERESGTSKS